MESILEFLRPYNIEILLLSIASSLISISLGLSIFIQKRRIEKQTKLLAKKLLVQTNEEIMNKGPSVFNVRGIVDGGVLIALVGVAMVAFISGRETVSKEAVKNKEEIKIENSVYRCREIRRKMLRYYDVQTGKYKYLPLNQNEGCFK